MTSFDFFPPLEPNRSGLLAVDPPHKLYWEECGNPNGKPVLFLHGGPGAGCSPNHRRFFDPAHYRIFLFDQRGAGRSSPHGEVSNNTTAHLIADIEQILDEIIFINQGELVLSSSVDEIRETHNKSVDGLFREVFKC